MPRAFVSIEITDDIRNQLVQVQEKLGETGADLKLVEPQNIHLTLRFLGDVPEKRLSKIKNAIRDAKDIADPFNLHVSGLGVFPNPNYMRVVWAGVSDGSNPTTALRQKLDKNLAKINLPSDNKEFTPHLTIARVKSGKAKEKLREKLTRMSAKDFGTCRVDAIELKESKLTPEGPIYSTLEKFELG
ncbi:hypothetical protein AKJ44_02760 [candidate division MSBL1 archaeon SCGC-AAA261F17]|uniref:RNA 2',3'-cyclic phosphodiesterase n=1 Tax=candidate division MSBL1 archaeon SCGC-AAA261F17 TaxID=1698274 RepID=A0A133V479_9EURY|nr:hypothetical protein AKJ44_02760 [candidate division MSBL1 archaeon SCGC-AAA261F17]